MSKTLYEEFEEVRIAARELWDAVCDAVRYAVARINTVFRKLREFKEKEK